MKIKTQDKTYMKECCRECGFPIDLERMPVILTKTDIALDMHVYFEEKCQTCGHQKSGWTIPCVYDHIRDIMKDKISKQKVKEELDKLESDIQGIIMVIRKTIKKDSPTFESDIEVHKFAISIINDIDNIKNRLGLGDE